LTTLERILKIKEIKGAGYFVLIDPDKWQPDELVKLAVQASEDGADAILVGGSLVLSSSFDELVKKIKQQIEVPLIIFPGSQTQISRCAAASFEID